MTPLRAFRCPDATYDSFRKMCLENGKGISESLNTLIDRALEADKTTKQVLYNPKNVLYNAEMNEGVN